MRERHNFSFAMMQPLVINVGACVEPCAMDIVACVLAMHICYVLLVCVCVIVCVCVFVRDYVFMFARLCARMV